MRYVLPHFIPLRTFKPQVLATYTTFSMLTICSTSFVTSLHTQGMSTFFTTAQHSGDGGSFGPDFETYCLHCIIRPGMLPSHCAKTLLLLKEARIPASKIIAKPKQRTTQVLTAITRSLPSLEL